MATYYVRNDGSNSNTGLGPGAAQAWQTLSKALGGSGISQGDTLYVAPGVYREQVNAAWIGSSATASTTRILADPTSSQFSGVSPAQVRVSLGLSGDSSTFTSGIALSMMGKSNWELANFYIEGGTEFSGPWGLVSIGGTNIVVRDCVLNGKYFGGPVGANIGMSFLNDVNNNITIKNNVLFGTAYGIYASLPYSTSLTYSGVKIYNNLILGNGWSNSYGIYVASAAGNTSSGVEIYNNTIGLHVNAAITIGSGNTFSPNIIKNNLIFSSSYGIFQSIANAGITTEDYNRFCTGNPRANVGTGLNSITAGHLGIDLFQSRINTNPTLQPFGPYSGSPLSGVGTAITLLTSDMFYTSWGARPDVGAITSKVLSSVGYYNPPEKQFNIYNFSQGATSQTLYFNLGAIGISYNSSNLVANYIRQGGTAITIPLVNQTPTGAWISGGFCEMDQINTPGIYRFDVPNAVLATGVNNSIVNIRGATTTNGATLQLNMNKAQLDLTQSIPTSNTPNTVGDALNAARAQGFGKWVITGTSLNLYAPDGTTIIRSFTLNSATEPTSRI